MNFLLNGSTHKVNSSGFISPSVQKAMFYFGSRKSGYIALGINALIEKFSAPITVNDIDEYEAECTGNFDRKPWAYIIEKHGGRLPVVVRSVPEGSFVEKDRPAVTVEILDSKCVWLGPYIEYFVFNELWYMSTVVTKMVKVLDLIELYGLKTIRFHYAKGCTSLEQSIKAALCIGLLTGEFSHHTLMSTAYEKESLNLSSTFYADHNVVLLNGEEETLSLFDNGFIVLDTFGNKTVNKELIKRLKEKQSVVADATNIYFVLLEVARVMYEEFGGEIIDDKKYIGKPIIQSASMTFDGLKDLIGKISKSEWYLGNFFFSIGADIFQNVSRDDHDFVYKCCAVDRGDGYIPVQKVSYNKVTFAGYPTLPVLVFDHTTEKKFTNAEIMENITNAKKYVAV